MQTQHAPAEAPHAAGRRPTRSTAEPSATLRPKAPHRRHPVWSTAPPKAVAVPSENPVGLSGFSWPSSAWESGLPAGARPHCQSFLRGVVVASTVGRVFASRERPGRLKGPLQKRLWSHAHPKSMRRRRPGTFSRSRRGLSAAFTPFPAHDSVSRGNVLGACPGTLKTRGVLWEDLVRRRPWRSGYPRRGGEREPGRVGGCRSGVGPQALWAAATVADA